MHDALPRDGRPLRVAVGTRPVPLAELVLVDDERVDLLHLKENLLDAQRDRVLAVLPRGRVGCLDVRDLVTEVLVAHTPAVFDRVPAGVRDRSLGRTVAFGEEPLLDAARLVAEDLVVVSRDAAGEWEMTAACVCFPSRWSLEEKIGRGLSAIHEPVPFYQERAAAAVRSLFDRLDERPVLRYNWTLLDSPELFQPQAGRAPVDAQAGLGDRLWSRIERQTMCRLPGGDALFTIRTTVRPLRDLRNQAPGALADLATSLEGTDPATIAYKGWTSLLPRLVEWFRSEGVEGAPDSRGRECDSAPPTRSVP